MICMAQDLHDRPSIEKIIYDLHMMIEDVHQICKIIRDLHGHKRFARSLEICMLIEDLQDH